MKYHFVLISLLWGFKFFLFLVKCEPCGVPGKNPNAGLARILGGEEARPDYYNWMVSLEVKVKNGNEIETDLCGGSLVSKNWVLTAAHCFKGSMTDLVEAKIILGQYKRKSRSRHVVVSQSSQIIKHPMFNNVTYENDIALVKMNMSLDFKNKHKHLGVICFPKADDVLTEKKCIVTGWGNHVKGLEEHGEVSNVLMEAKVPVREYSHCEKRWGKDFDRKRQVCAGFDDGHKDFCSGDSGGPLICHGGKEIFTQYGLVSYGSLNLCGEAKQPGVYTKVFPFVSWINKTLRPQYNFHNKFSGKLLVLSRSFKQKNYFSNWG